MSEILNILGSVGFNWHVALANFFNFLIILILLNIFFFKKLGKVINERHDAIEQGLNNARDAEQALLSAHDEKATIIKSAHQEKGEMLKRAEDDAKKIVADRTIEAEREISAVKEKLAESERNLKSSVEQSFGEQAPVLVAKLYAKTLAKNMTKDDNDALILSMKA